MNVKERIAALLNAYYGKNRHLPLRITVSGEVARELDAVIQASRVDFISPLGEQLMLLQDGHAHWFMGVLLVADLKADDVLDVR